MKKIKRIIVLCFVSLIAVTINKSVTNAQDTLITEGDFTYSINGTSATLTGYFRSNSTVIIPDSVNGAAVQRVFRCMQRLFMLL